MEMAEGWVAMEGPAETVAPGAVAAARVAAGGTVQDSETAAAWAVAQVAERMATEGRVKVAMVWVVGGWEAEKVLADEEPAVAVALALVEVVGSDRVRTVAALVTSTAVAETAEVAATVETGTQETACSAETAALVAKTERGLGSED